MSSSSESSHGKVHPSGRSSFGHGHRFNLLSQYLKEKGSFGDLSLAISAPVPQVGEETGYFPMQKPVVKSTDLFPGESGFGISDKEGIPRAVAEDDTRSSKPELAQMTIFYGGQVIVFDNFPSDKAKEVMLLASRSSSQFYSTPASDITGATTKKAPDAHPILPIIPRTPEPTGLNLPLAWRKSLRRFLEKRKDRITSRAPYTKTGDDKNASGADGSPISNPASSSNNYDDDKSWLSLSAQRH
ncbi:hypothetical protein MLD38_006961 [Melastoma candidum]|uniref:Uncharacterized protein n=1 Tax=Melastoma candidum TaxID=119954 RepID=A0ACB9RPI9_9MYRT|nr:hypothetical protein MLD38_006961 [Melastoma candidum]